LLLQSRHYTVRSYSASRRGPILQIAVVLSTLALLGGFVAGGAWLVSHFRLGVPVPVSTLVIQDDYDGVPVAGARVTVLPLTCPKDACAPREMSAQGPVGHAFDTNAQGRVRVQLPGERAIISISRQGYDTRQAEISWPPSAPIPFMLRPTGLAGRITLLGKPLTNMRVMVMTAPVTGPPAPAASANTDENGAYRFTDVPEGATLMVEAPGVSPRARPIGRHTTFDLALRPDVLTGTVRDPGGQAVPNLTVVSGSLITQTKPDGSFTLSGIDASATVIVKGIGYRPQEIPIGDTLTQQITVQPFVAKGIYVQASTAAKPAELDKLITQLNASDMNTMVVDLKDNNGAVYYDTKVALAHEVDAVQPILNVPQLMTTLHSHGIYAIARIVVMEDPIAGVKRPDLAIHDTRTGKPWRNNNGQTWLNAANPQVWQYVTDLATEAATLGFDEVQFDYVRFPTDGNLDVADFGANFPGGETARRAAITGLLTKAHEALRPTRALFGADVFGITAWIRNDNGIGQQFEDLVASVDVICPMDYPSHYGKGFLRLGLPEQLPI